MIIMEKVREVEILKESIKKSEIPEEKQNAILDNAKDKILKEKTMDISIKEGSASSVMSGFGDSYITPFALALNANNAQIGLLSSFPSLLAPIAQIFGSRLMEKYPRRTLIVTGVTLHALMWLPILSLAYLFWKGLFSSYLPVILIVFYSLYAIFGAIAGPAWFSLLGDIVPEKIRGKYFSKRNKICGTIALVFTLIGALILDYFKTKGIILIGFSILFFFSFVFRFISSRLFKKHYDPEFKLSEGYYFSIWQFIKKAPKNNFGRFVIFVSLIHLSTAIAGPFFTVYMLEDLNFSYTTFMIVNLSSSITTLLFLPMWGKFSDKYGNRELLRIGSIIIPFLPILWLLSESPVYLMLVPQLIGGIGWGAFNFAASNFIYDSVSPQRRGLCVSYFNVFVGVGTFTGAAIGGLIAQFVTISFMNIFLFIFLVSGILRLLVALIIMPSVKEVRKVKKSKSNPLLYFKEMRPMHGIVYGIAHDLRGIKKMIIKKDRQYL